MAEKKGDSPEGNEAPRTLLNVRANFSTREREQPPGKTALPTVKLIGKCDFCRETFSLPEGNSTVGRVLGACIVLIHEQVSRRHATFIVDRGLVRLVDHGSRNGTFVNGVQVRESELHNGDLLAFGRELHFQLAIEQPAREPFKTTIPEPVLLDKTRIEAAPTVENPYGPPSGGGDLAALERQRMQLAVLFSLSLRYLRQSGVQDPVDVLFEVLDKLVAFDAAFVVGSVRGAPPRVHPGGSALTPTECARAAPEEALTEVRVLEAPEDALTLQGKSFHSRAYLPFEGGAYLALLSAERLAYSDRLEFLGLLAELHAAAVHRAGRSDEATAPLEPTLLTRRT